ncbi:hypothetical protein KUCAC02_016927 [Chaenocephalus aceratus]|nr:hypothetical protein KUCAC02_016927 [Chaenocephalus aceratus]
MWKDISRTEVRPAPLREISFHKPKRLGRQLPAASTSARKNMLTDDDIRELRDVDPGAAVLTSLENSDTETASSDIDSEEHPDLPEPLTALFDATLRELSPQEMKRACEYCERPDFGKMIIYVKCNNHIHYSCARIKRKPATWLCRKCLRVEA